MTKIKENSILITGGASGIGRIMGRMALEKGARQLVIWDINEQSIASTEAELSKYGKVKGYRVDVSDAAAIEQAYKRVCEECGNIDILINCAGVVTGKLANDPDRVCKSLYTFIIHSTILSVFFSLPCLSSILLMPLSLLRVTLFSLYSLSNSQAFANNSAL